MSIFSRFFKGADQEAKPSTNDLEYLSQRLTDWLTSPEREEMLTGCRYYQGAHDVLNKKRTAIGEDGEVVEIKNLPNNKIVDNQYSKAVDQKANYALARPLTIASENEEYMSALGDIFTKRTSKQLLTLAKSSINEAIAYLYPYVDKNGDFQVMVFGGHEIMPIWADQSHLELTSAVRHYTAQEWSHGALKDIERVEVYTENGVDRYIRRGGKLVVDAEAPHKPYLSDSNGNAYNWGRVPIIPFKYNDEEIPLIRRVKCLQDSINTILSNFQDNLQEDPRNTILILENYDGANLAEFRRNLATYGAVKVHTVDGVKGGVHTLSVEVDANNYTAILIQLKRALVENARGFDAKEERMDGDPNQMNIQSMYSDIDLDVDAMETEYQYGFECLLWFINKYLAENGKGDFSEDKVEFIFNRNILINESDIIQNCVASKGVISDETIISHHPWVVDLEREKRQIDEDEKFELEDMSAFPKPAQPAKDVDGGKEE